MSIKWGFGIFLVAWAMVLVFWSVARAHDAIPTATQPLGWKYGYECCSGIDCYQQSAADIREVKTGYLVVATGEVIPYGAKNIKQSKDEFFHRCSHGGKKEAKTICIYVPNRGF